LAQSAGKEDPVKYFYIYYIKKASMGSTVGTQERYYYHLLFNLFFFCLLPTSQRGPNFERTL
jgi:hypothetical protein